MSAPALQLGRVFTERVPPNQANAHAENEFPELAFNAGFVLECVNNASISAVFARFNADSTHSHAEAARQHANGNAGDAGQAGDAGEAGESDPNAANISRDHANNARQHARNAENAAVIAAQAYAEIVAIRNATITDGMPHETPVDIGVVYRITVMAANVTTAARDTRLEAIDAWFARRLAAGTRQTHLDNLDNEGTWAADHAFDIAQHRANSAARAAYAYQNADVMQI
jgi:hypothetical protein